MSAPPPPRRPIRSYVLRQGRLTAAQARARTELWPRYGLDFERRPLALDAAFGRRAARVLEIGFGNGEALATAARDDPERDYLGIEVHGPGVGRLLRRLAADGIGNVRVVQADAVEVLEYGLPPDALAEVWIYFPDPWPKARHHKRRLIQPRFAALVASRVQPGGILRLATDWQPYAEQMLAVLNACPALSNDSPSGGYVERPAVRPATHFERRGQRLGHAVYDLAYRRR